MSSNFLVGTCIALGVLVTWNTWTLYQVNKRLEAMEQLGVPKSVKEVSKLTSSQSTRYAGSGSYKSASVEGKKTKKISMNNLSRDNMPALDQSSIDLSDPDIQEAIAKIAENNAQKKEQQRRQSKMEAYKVSLKHELEKFSKEKEYDSDTVQSIESILDESATEWRAVREQVREGEISWMDARTEFKAIGDETESKVTEFISSEDYKELRSRLWGDWGR